MKKLKKLLVALLAATLMVSALPLSASAAKIENEATPWWTNTGVVNCYLSINDDGSASAEALIRGKAGVSSIECDVYVYVMSGSTWTYVTEGHFSTQAAYLVDCCEFTARYGCSYKAEYTITVTKNGVDEVITHTSYSSYP